LPAVTGSNVTELPVGNTEVVRQTIRGKEYRVFTLWQARLTTLREGDFTFSPLTAENSIHFRTADGRSGDYAGPAISNEVTLHVLALPTEGRPEGFSGLIGSYRVQASAVSSPAQASVADTLRVEISGTGNFEPIRTPNIVWPAGTSAFTGKQVWSVAEDHFPLQGKVSIAVPFVPDSPGRAVIPALALVYFDPESGTYQRARSDSVVLTVERATASGPVGAGAAVISPADSTAPGGSAAAGGSAPALKSWLPWGIWGGAGLLAIVIGVVVFRRKTGIGPQEDEASGSGSSATGAAAERTGAAAERTGAAAAKSGASAAELGATPTDTSDVLRQELERLQLLEEPDLFFSGLEKWLSLVAATEPGRTDVADDLAYLSTSCNEYLYAGVGSASTLPRLKDIAESVLQKIEPYDKNRSAAIP
jgi:hypothetical protein